ncbi:indole-3-glycerol phosphate synthase TrpC [Chloroflexota bacterium]
MNKEKTMILDEIVTATRKSLARRKAQTPLSTLERERARQPLPRDFAGALEGQGISLIAEVKRASPSKGALRLDLDAAALASTYSQSGAAAISVLTESSYFRGSLADLEAVRRAVRLPILCKDFIVDPYQIYEASAYGADAVLLIVAVLTQEELGLLLETAHLLEMEALIEVHNRDELMRALELSPRVIGINNRNLADFSVDLETTFKLRPLVPPETVVVSESGIDNRKDLICLEEAGVSAILVGEALVINPNPAAKIRELLG